MPSETPKRASHLRPFTFSFLDLRVGARLHLWPKGRVWQAGTSRNYHELTVALNRLPGMFRLDLGVRLDRPGWSWGISYARIF